MSKDSSARSVTSKGYGGRYHADDIKGLPLGNVRDIDGRSRTLCLDAINQAADYTHHMVVIPPAHARADLLGKVLKIVIRSIVGCQNFLTPHLDCGCTKLDSVA